MFCGRLHLSDGAYIGPGCTGHRIRRIAGARQAERMPVWEPDTGNRGLEETMMNEKPWVPNLDEPDNFMEHKNPLGDTPRLTLPDPADSAPLEGSQDLSDADSLPDVVAASFDKKTAPPKPSKP